MKICVVIGHEPKSPGAYSSHLGLSEYIYNSEVAAHLSNVADIYRRPMARGYTAQMIQLGQLLKPKNYDLTIELHFNAANKKAQGTETVTYKGNERTKTYGKVFNEIISNKYKVANRGEKEVTTGGRGFGFLSMMPGDAIILEPFFGDQIDSLRFKDTADYACCIKEWLLRISK